jgi:hypothetical protein
MSESTALPRRTQAACDRPLVSHNGTLGRHGRDGCRPGVESPRVHHPVRRSRGVTVDRQATTRTKRTEEQRMTRWIRRTDLLIAYTAVIVTATFLAVLLWH